MVRVLFPQVVGQGYVCFNKSYPTMKVKKFHFDVECVQSSKKLVLFLINVMDLCLRRLLTCACENSALSHL